MLCNKVWELEQISIALYSTQAQITHQSILICPSSPSLLFVFVYQFVCVCSFFEEVVGGGGGSVKKLGVDACKTFCLTRF